MILTIPRVIVDPGVETDDEVSYDSSHDQVSTVDEDVT